MRSPAEPCPFEPEAAKDPPEKIVDLKGAGI
jgi:hypothetical protein